jgi:hypothetical protein
VLFASETLYVSARLGFCSAASRVKLQNATEFSCIFELEMEIK